MKKILAVFIVMALLPSLAAAEPFLVCDPMTNVDQTRVTVSGSQEPWQDYTEATVDGVTYCVLMDLAGIPEGSYIATAAARNIWGESSESDPFDFTKTVPTGVVSIDLKRISW